MRREAMFPALAALALAILCGGCGATFASTIYDFSGTLTDGASVTGTFTYNPANDTISSFSFDLPTLPNPVSTITSANGYVAVISSTLFQFIEDGASYDEYLTLDFNSLPGAVSTSLGGLIQYPSAYGSAADYSATFSSGSATLAATPLPPSWTMLLGSLIGFGLLFPHMGRKSLISIRPQAA
jgi:hypothetical protein